MMTRKIWVRLTSEADCDLIVAEMHDWTRGGDKMRDCNLPSPCFVVLDFHLRQITYDPLQNPPTYHTPAEAVLALRAN